MRDAEVSYIKFKGSTFADYADFSDLRVETAYFDKCIFGGETEFRGASIDIGSFLQTEFNGPTDFSHAVFSSYVPMFFSAKLDEDTNFYRVHWPVPNPRRWGEHGSGKFVRAYECLRRLMSSQGKHQMENHFLRLEMRCQVYEQGWLESLPIRIYGIIADFGLSILRPTFGLVFCWLFSAGYFASEICETENGISEVFSECALDMAGISFSNLFIFLGIGRTLLADKISALDNLPFGEFLAGAQMVIGPILLFFALLALRNRFRMK